MAFRVFPRASITFKIKQPEKISFFSEPSNACRAEDVFEYPGFDNVQSVLDKVCR